MNINEYVAANAKAMLPCKNGEYANIVGSIGCVKLTFEALGHTLIFDLVSLYPQ